MNEEKGQEPAALGESMVARIEIEEIGIAANEKEMTDSVTGLPGVREVKIATGACMSLTIRWPRLRRRSRKRCVRAEIR